MSISDVFKPTSGGGGGFCAAGRIETGYIQKSDTVLISPLNEYATVKVGRWKEFPICWYLGFIYMHGAHLMI